VETGPKTKHKGKLRHINTGLNSSRAGCNLMIGVVDGWMDGWMMD